MEESTFLILSALQNNFKSTFTKKEAAEHLRHNPNVIYDGIEYIGQHLDNVLYTYYDRTAETEESEYFTVNPFAAAALLQETRKRETERIEIQRQSDLIQSTLDTNAAVRRTYYTTFGIGLVSLIFIGITTLQECNQSTDKELQNLTKEFQDIKQLYQQQKTGLPDIKTSIDSVNASIKAAAK